MYEVHLPTFFVNLVGGYSIHGCDFCVTVPLIPGQALEFLSRDEIKGRVRTRLSDGIPGTWMTNGYPFGYTNIARNVWFSPAWGEVGFYMFSNTLPASVEIELGVLEDRTLQRAESIPDSNHAQSIISRNTPARCTFSASASRFATLTPRPINENIKRTSNIRYIANSIEHRTSNIQCGSERPVSIQCSALDVECCDVPASSRHSSPATRHSQSGVALIITLILLSVVTFMAITFLALSRRERGAVTTVTDTASARLAADAALANAEAQIMANVLATTNPFNFGLLVSTNYINPNGFMSGVSSFNNVNYYDTQTEIL